ncbi:MAG: isocitrate/isopropylmalate dehydrogenase family protein [Rhodospirillaceae bacterium]
MKLLILPGDGIGPEITEATCRALEALDARFGLDFDMARREIGLAAHKSRGSTMPEDVMAEIKATEAVILGPTDTYSYPPEAQGGITPSRWVRTTLDLYANIRPSRTRPGVPAMAKQMDLVIARENTEGFYADRNMFLGNAEFMPTPDVALSVRKVTVAGSRRIARAAFDLARARRKKVTVVHKANVLKVTDGMFLREARDVGKDYPDVEVEEKIIDAMAALLIRKPESFDVVLTTNMFGDILSDQCAELSGGLGLGPSINAGEDHAIAQAAHGSAPDIAGQDLANPTALMLSTTMLLDWIARRHGDNNLAAAAAHMDRAVDAALADPKTQTKDLGGPLGTRAFGEAVAKTIAELQS